MRFPSLALALLCIPGPAGAGAQAANGPAWRTLPVVKPTGEQQSTGSYTIATEQLGKTGWKKPPFIYNEKAATGRKEAKVIVLIYNPTLPGESGKSLIDYVHGNDPVEYSHILANVVRDASWGYINYNIVDFVWVNGFPRKTDGFQYTPDTFLADRKTQKWQPATSSYRGMLADNGLLERIKKEHINEVWVWGASGMAMDEFAMFIPNRYARYAPTDNPWFYRPYDIPDVGHTLWMMGFNYEVGSDNMIHSYTHRVESMGALAIADGIWDTAGKRDPWNVFTWLETDHPGTPSMVGNAHVPPNGQSGYDYNNKRKVESWADNWAHYPDLRGPEREISSEEWCNNQTGYQRWILNHVPKYPGHTKYGYNNWWVYIANTDEDLPDYKMPDMTTFRLPTDYPPPSEQSKP